MPAFLPAPARHVIPWARRYAAQTARRAHLSLEDTWDETVTALMRASVYFHPGAGSFSAYARTAVIRGLWRYCRRPKRLTGIPDWEFARAVVAPSAETVADLLDLAMDYAVSEARAAASMDAGRSSSTRASRS